MFSGKISTKENAVETLNKIQLAMVSDGFEVERVGHGLIVRVSSLKDFLFQTQPGKIFLSELVLESVDGVVRYSFIYRMQMELIVHLAVTLGMCPMLSQNYSVSNPDFWISLVMVNELVAVFRPREYEVDRHLYQGEQSEAKRGLPSDTSIGQNAAKPRKRRPRVDSLQ